MRKARRKLMYAAAAGVAALLAVAAGRMVLAQTSPPPKPTWYLCDINGDRAVNEEDLALFREAWLKQHPPAPQEPRLDVAADFDVSGSIDHQDAKAMIEYYLNPDAASVERGQ